MNTQPEEKTHTHLFREDATKRAKLKALLADPVLAEAFDIADDLMRPKSGTPADANQFLSIAKFHQSAGVSEFQDKLRVLTRPLSDRKPLEARKLAKSPDDLPKE